MIGFQDARTMILDAVQPVGRITVALERSLNHVLAESIIAAENIPPFDNSAMDGYAVRTEDLQRTPCMLRIVGEVAAGRVAPKALQPGEVMSIMTGAKIPPGCDAVVQQEWSESPDKTQVNITRRVERGHNIRPAGADIHRGATVLEPGVRIRPQEIGVLASLGTQFVEVYRRLSVAILATGNEIVGIDKPLADAKIRNSNAYTLAALVEELGCDPLALGVARDDRDELKRKITEGLKADLLVTTGGISVGKYDLVMEILREIGAEVKFWKVNIKPGMPLLFALHGVKPVFGLPGNPVSSMVTFLHFVKPAVRRMSGEKTVDTGYSLHAKLEHEIKKIDGKRHFIRGILESRNGALSVRSTGPQVSNILSSLTKANCLIILPEEGVQFRAGEDVEVELL
jgi:molybdopterin molybdotransferase